MKWTTIGSVQLHLPAEYLPLEDCDGVTSADRSASIVVTQLPGPWQEVVAGLTPENLAARGMHWLGQEERSIAGVPGYLFHLRQDVADSKFVKWLGLIGDEQRTTLITGSAALHDQEASDAVREAICNARAAEHETTTTRRSRFRITPTEPFRETEAPPRQRLFVAPAEASSGSQRFLAAGCGELAVPPDEQAKFCYDRIRQIDGVRDVNVTGEQELELDGRPARESLAEGRDVEDRELTIYQVVIFAETEYFLLQGLASPESKPETIACFRTMANSFRRIHDDSDSLDR